MSATDAQRLITWRHRPSPGKERVLIRHWKIWKLKLLDWCQSKPIHTNRSRESLAAVQIGSLGDKTLLATPLILNILTNKSTRTLLHNFHTKRSRHMWLITVTFNWNILCFIKSFISTTVVYAFWICLGWTLITPNWEYWKRIYEFINLLLLGVVVVAVTMNILFFRRLWSITWCDWYWKYESY